MEYVLAIGIFCFERVEPSSVMAERRRERERERENRGEGTKLWGPITVISEFQSGFESCLNPKTVGGVFSNLP